MDAMDACTTLKQTQSIYLTLFSNITIIKGIKLTSPLHLCAVIQVQGSPAFALGGGERTAPQKLAARRECT